MECYIDSYFFINWWMDVQILHVVDAVLGRRTSRKKKYLVAIIGAFSACVFLWNKILGLGILGCLFFYQNEMLAMVIVTFLFGGSMTLFAQHSMFFLMISSFVLCRLFVLLLKKWQKKKQLAQLIVEVTLTIKGEQISLQALLDTGNQLLSNSKPVHILEQEYLLNIAPQLTIRPEEIKYIPFQSVGNPRGVLPAIQVEQMSIFTPNEKIVRCNEMIALSKNSLSEKGAYHMLLHSSIERSLYVAA
jgi:stage II sporulation protein GA (sporulation sigma-E factor processing peptidase)